MPQTIQCYEYAVDCEAKRAVVYLHGKGGFYGEAGLFEFDDFPKLLQNGAITAHLPFIVLRASGGEHWDLNELDTTLATVQRRYPNAQLHLMGYSRGGTAVYRYISAYKRASFATVINARLIDCFRTDIPLHVLHARHDHTQSVDAVRDFAAQHAAKGVPVSLDIVEGDHFNIGDIARAGKLKSPGCTTPMTSSASDNATCV